MPPAERMVPTQTGKAADDRIVRMYVCLILHRHGNHMHVCHQVCPHTRGREIVPQVAQMVGSGADGHNVGKPKPDPHAIHRFFRAGRMVQTPGILPRH